MTSRFRKSLYCFRMLLLVLSLCMAAPVCAGASETETENGTSPADSTAQNTSQDTAQPSAEETKQTEAGKTVTKKKKKKGKYNKWVKKDGYYYYYNENGRKAKGLTKIKKKTYLFDQKGRQLHGWQKVKKSYYYFYLTPGKKGCMAAKTTVNGIYLKKNGKAKVSADNWKLYCLLKCSEIVAQYTKPTWSTGEKMRTIWNRYLIDWNKYWGVIWYNYDNWGVYYAYSFFRNGGGSCEGLGCAWAFLANACGAKNCYAVCSGSGSGILNDGHGWAEVDGLFYDPARAIYEPRVSSFYGLGYLYPYRDWYHRYKV